jgi:hypothetical protein
MRLRLWLLRTFPRAWRDRYGHEVADLLTDIESDERRLRASDLLDLVRAGASQRCLELWRRVAHPRRHLVAHIAAGGVGLAAIALVALVATSAISGPTSPSPLTHVVAGSGAPLAGQQTAAQQAAEQAAAQQAAARAADQAAEQAGDGVAAQTTAERAAEQAAAGQQAAAQAAVQQAAEGAAVPVG